MNDTVGSQSDGDGEGNQDVDATREKLERIRLHMDNKFSEIRRSALIASGEDFTKSQQVLEDYYRSKGKEYLFSKPDEMTIDARIRMGALEHIPRSDLEFINSTLALLDDFSKRELAIALIASEYMVRKQKYLAEAIRREEKLRREIQISRANRLYKYREELITTKAQVDKDRRARRRGAMKTNAESYAMKQDVFRWLDQNFERYGKFTAATDAIVKANLVLAKWGTIRDWCAEWKKLRSASAP